jgi:hypothetical protein
MQIAMPYKARVLQDHLKRGNTFYPPFTFEHGESRFTQVEWRADILPELIWIGLLIQSYGFDEAREMACALAFLADQSHVYGVRPNFGTVSGYDQMTPLSQAAITERLARQGVRDRLTTALCPLIRLYPKCPLKFLLAGRPPGIKAAQARAQLAPVIDECLYRHEKLPTLVQGIYYDALLASGKMKLVAPVARHDTNVLKGYPESEDSQRVAALVRCCATGLPMEASLPGATRSIWWPQYFWRKGLRIGQCEPVKPRDVHPNSLPQSFLLFLMNCFGTYNDQCVGHWDRIHSAYRYDIYSPLRDEVLLGLASRIYRLTVQIVSFPVNWTEDVEQVYLRMVVESYIYYQWLKTKGSQRDFEKFYHHGLGQQKLRMEHTKAYLKAQGVDAHDADLSNEGLRFLKSHKMPEFVPVNIGNPLDKDLRTLADEADIKEFHALVYGPTSSAVHGLYDTLDQFYLRECRNPFHCRHKIPYYWYKSALSCYGVCNTLSIVDWILADLLTATGQPIPEAMPGQTFLATLFDESSYKEFIARDDIAKQSEAQERMIRQAWEKRAKKHPTRPRTLSATRGGQPKGEG